MKRNILAIAAAVLLVTSGPAVSAEWTDLSLGYRYGKDFREPANPSDVQKNTFNLTSVNGYKHGSNFASLDILKSDSKDPANGKGSNGAQELFFVYNHQFGYGKIVNGAPLNYGILKDVSLMVGTDLSAKNTQFAPGKEALYIGPTFNLTIPTPTPGWFDVSIRAYKEWNHNSFGADKNVVFDPTYMLAVAWGVPFNIASASFNFKGFANLIGDKGKDAQLKDTATEALMRTYLMGDIGAVMGKPKLAYLGVGFEYWHNKFGNPNNSTTNKTTTCPMIAFELHPF